MTKWKIKTPKSLAYYSSSKQDQSKEVAQCKLAKKNSWNQQTQKDNTTLKAIVFIWTIFRVFHFSSSCRARIDLNTEFEQFFLVLGFHQRCWNIENVMCLAQFVWSLENIFKKCFLIDTNFTLHQSLFTFYPSLNWIVFGRFCNEELLGSTFGK